MAIQKDNLIAQLLGTTLRENSFNIGTSGQSWVISFAGLSDAEFFSLISSANLSDDKHRADEANGKRTLTFLNLSDSEVAGAVARIARRFES
jgi:hypothetical protein